MKNNLLDKGPRSRNGKNRTVRFCSPSLERESVRFPIVRAYYHTVAAVASSGSNVIAGTILIPDWPDVPERLCQVFSVKVGNILALI